MSKNISGIAIGARIDKTRKERNLTLKQVGDFAGVSGQAVGQWISGDTKNLGAVNALFVADGFGVSIRWLLFGEQPSDNAYKNDQIKHVTVKVAEEQSTYESNQDILEAVTKLGQNEPSKLLGLRLLLGIPLPQLPQLKYERVASISDTTDQ